MIFEQRENNTDMVARDLNLLLDVLKKEREAIGRADAKLVGEIAKEKEMAARILAAHTNMRQEPLTKDLAELAMQVAQTASTNDILLRDMQRYYLGMIDMMLKQVGRLTTYGRDGALGLTEHPVGKARIMV
ncbi:MAG: hypothetical protein JXR91_10180 [Deltaproteobacteria bacterium]|nr:hypothetical protein [Deltaproteobacteria bacterium]